MGPNGTVLDAAAPARALPTRARWRRRLRSRSAIGLLMCLPLVAPIGGLVAYPFFYAIYLSMLNKRETAFIGLDNFRFLMTRDVFWQVVQTSFVFTGLAVFWKAVLGFTVALVIHTVPTGGQRIWRGLALIPWGIPLALSTLGWRGVYTTPPGARTWAPAA